MHIFTKPRKTPYLCGFSVFLKNTGVLTPHGIIKIKTINFETGVRKMVKSLNLKNIKNEMKKCYMDYETYNKLWESLRTLYEHGFIDWEMWCKIFDYDTFLFNSCNK